MLAEALDPDAASSVRNTSTNSSCSSPSPSASVMPRPSSMARLARAWAATAPAASSPARSIARSCSSSGGTTSSTRPMAQRLVGLHLTAGEDEVLGPRGADQAGQPLGAAATGDDAEQDLGLTERGAVRCDAEVAGQRQLAAATQGVADDRGDRDPRESRRPRRARCGTRAPISAASSGPPNSEISAPAAKMRSPPVTTTAPGRSAQRSDTVMRNRSSTRSTAS